MQLELHIEQLSYWSEFCFTAARILLGSSVTTIMARCWWRKCLVRPAASAPPTAAWAVSGIFSATGLQFYIANWVIITFSINSATHFFWSHYKCSSVYLVPIIFKKYLDTFRYNAVGSDQINGTNGQNVNGLVPGWML